MGSNSVVLKLSWPIALLASIGCGSGDGFVASTGSVTFDGTPVAAAAISFHPLDQGAAPQGAQIIAGRFRIRTLPGRYRVEIVAGRPQAGGEELTPGMPRLEQYIPDRYNAASVLEADVTPRGPNAFTFVLSTSDVK